MNRKRKRRVDREGQEGSPQRHGTHGMDREDMSIIVAVKAGMEKHAVEIPAHRYFLPNRLIKHAQPGRSIQQPTGDMEDTLLGAHAEIQTTVRYHCLVGTLVRPQGYFTLVRCRIKHDSLLWEEGPCYRNLLKLRQHRGLGNHDGLWIAITDGVGVDSGQRSIARRVAESE